MTNKEKYNILTDGLKELFDFVPAFEVTETTTLAEFNLDSLDAIELQLYVEDRLNIETIDPEGKIITVNDFLKLIP